MRTTWLTRRRGGAWLRAAVACLLGAACSLELPNTDRCPLTVVQTHDVPQGTSRVQEYEVLEPPYRVEMSSRDQHTGEPVAIVSIHSDAWGSGQLDFVNSGPGFGPIDGYTDVSVLESDEGLGHILADEGRYTMDLSAEGSGCTARVEVEAVPDAGSWSPGEAETQQEFDWRDDSDR